MHPVDRRRKLGFERGLRHGGEIVEVAECLHSPIFRLEDGTGSGNHWTRRCGTSPRQCVCRLKASAHERQHRALGTLAPPWRATTRRGRGPRSSESADHARPLARIGLKERPRRLRGERTLASPCPRPPSARELQKRREHAGARRSGRRGRIRTPSRSASIRTSISTRTARPASPSQSAFSRPTTSRRPTMSERCRTGVRLARQRTVSRSCGGLRRWGLPRSPCGSPAGIRWANTAGSGRRYCHSSTTLRKRTRTSDQRALGAAEATAAARG